MICKMSSCWILVCAVFNVISCFSVGNPVDIDGIIDLDHDSKSHDSYHDNIDAIDTSQYYFRSSKEHKYVPLYRNPHVDLNAPLCYLENEELVCDHGKHTGTYLFNNQEGTIAVAIANENGTLKMGGIVTSDDDDVKFEPVKMKGQENNHVIKKRWTANVVHRRNWNRKLPPFKSRSRFSRYEIPQPESSGNCVDIICVIDYSIFKKFQAKMKTTSATLERLRYYYAHVINGINLRYSSIKKKEVQLKIRLAGYFVAKKPKDLPFISAWEMAANPRFRVNGRDTLESLDAYLKKLQRKDKRLKIHTLPEYNHAMLFLEHTATNLGGSILGTSFVNGICSDSRSTSLVVDHGAYTSAGIGTHELGHNLGVQDHDGEGNARSAMCNASRNYIMAPASYLIDESNLKYSFTFSKCSVKQIQDNLERLSRSALQCLSCSSRSGNTVEDTSEYLSILPGTKDSVHDQCIELYGEGSFMCPPKSPKEMCYRMYCYDPKRSACAIISEQMAIPGTPCGSYKVCKLGKCEYDRRGKDVPDDCPYPDIPSNGAHCEDATPFMCQNERFRRKCCQSCNKDFTEEEACKDTHMIINRMTCAQLTKTVLGKFACQSDEKVKNYCCRSCRDLQKRGSQLGVSVLTPAAQPQNSWISRQTSRNFISQRNPSVLDNTLNSVKRGTIGSVIRKSWRSTPQLFSRISRITSRPVVNQRTNTVTSVIRQPVSVSSQCVDSKRITINKMKCPDLVAKEGIRVCQFPQVKSICCYTCSKYLK